MAERLRTAAEKYVEFFAGWRRRYDRPHDLEARWMKDNAGEVRTLAGRK